MSRNEQPKSTDKDYVPLTKDELFASLCAVTDQLDRIGVPYILTGGTLLGAVREKDLITGDSDWDLEVLNSDVSNILKHKKEIESLGFVLEYPCLQNCLGVHQDVDPLLNSDQQIIKIKNRDGKAHGDFFVQTLFQDGVLRRVNVKDSAYFNAKMSFPFWFFKNRKKIAIRDRQLWGPAEPEMMLRRVYGDDWHVPLKRHSKVPGKNFSGAVKDSNMEEGFLHALGKGWIPYYPDAHPWPLQIDHTTTEVSYQWIKKHEHPEILDYGIKLDNLPPSERAYVTGQLYRIMATDLKNKLAKLL